MKQFNMWEVYSHLSSPGVLADWSNYTAEMQYYDTPIAILHPMNGPVIINAGQCATAVSVNIDHIDHEVALAKMLYAFMKEKEHNAFAFYEFRIMGIERHIRFATLKI